MAWTVWVCDTVTGNRLQRLPVSDFPWERLLNAGAGQKTATVQMADATTQKLDVAALTTPWANTLALDWDGYCEYAGVITGRPKYDWATKAWTIQHEDFWSLLAGRFAVNHSVADVSVWSQTYTGISLRQLAKNLVILGTTGPANANITLPVTFMADETGALTRTVYGYHLNGLVDSLKSVTAEDGGPDIDFQPQWVSGKLNHLMRVGTPTLNAGSHEWNLLAQNPGVAALTVAEDATKQITSSVAVGEGTGTDTVMQSNRILNPPIPHLERMSPYKTVSDRTELDALSRGDLAKFTTPTKQWDFSILADGPVGVSSLLPGDTARIYSKGDLVIPDGWNVHRITGYSGDLTTKVQLQIQPGGA